MTDLLTSLAKGVGPDGVEAAKSAAGRNSSSSGSASAAPAASQAVGEESDGESFYEPDHAEDQEDGGLSDGRESVDALDKGRDELAEADASKQPSSEEMSGGKFGSE